MSQLPDYTVALYPGWRTLVVKIAGQWHEVRQEVHPYARSDHELFEMDEPDPEIVALPTEAPLTAAEALNYHRRDLLGRNW